MQDKKAKHKIYGNYQSMQLIIEYIFNSFYFSKCNVEEQKDETAEEENESLAKQLLVPKGKNNDKTAFAKIITMLHHKHDDNEEEEDEEDEDEEEVVGHPLLILSNIISVSGKREDKNCGLLIILKTMEAARLISYNA